MIKLYNWINGYVIAAVAFVGILVASYLKGRSDTKQTIEATQNKKKLEDIKKSERIENEVRKTPDSDIDRKLSKWLRD